MRHAVPSFVLLACLAAPASAQPAAPAVESAPLGASHPTLDKIIADYADSGIDGVVDIVKNKDGEIVKMVVVGAAKISCCGWRQLPWSR